jgi:hypothetical protein
VPAQAPAAIPAVLAHGFGIRYDLPVPLYLYLIAAGAVVTMSFVLVAVFVGTRAGERDYPRFPLDRVPLIGPLSRGLVPRLVGGTIGVLVLLAIIVSGLLGAPDATGNPAEYLLWIYFWAGTVLVSSLVGNLYALLNPFIAIYNVAARLLRASGRGLRPYPERLGLWPAVVGYFLFAYFELASGQSGRPRSVAAAALLYTVYTLVMMVTFGRSAWLDHGETFSVLFKFIGAFGPVEKRDGAVYLRPWAVGLTQLELQGWDVIAFVILTLSSLAFDGFSATPLWALIYLGLGGFTDSVGAVGPPMVKAAGLLGLSLVFTVVYMLVVRVVDVAGKGRGDLVPVASVFAFTLIPIALVYNAAHNYSYMVIQGQGLIPLLADPLHTGAHLLPTAGYKPSFAFADAGFVWYLQVVLIVTGHVVAVYLAHRRALATYPGRAATRSQYPMLLLMVAYTAVSLWILAQPITESG